MWKQWKGSKQVPIFYWISCELCNACSPTFHWSVECTQCSCRVCRSYGAHSTEIVSFSIVCKILSEGRCFHIFAWYCVYKVSLLCYKFWACLYLNLRSSGWKCTTVLHLPYLIARCNSRQETCSADIPNKVVHFDIRTKFFSNWSLKADF